MNKKMLYRCGLEKLGDASSLLTVAGALLILIVFFAIGTPYFLSGKNFLNIGLYAAIVGCISCSVTFINISGMIDLSVGGGNGGGHCFPHGDSLVSGMSGGSGSRCFVRVYQWVFYYGL